MQIEGPAQADLVRELLSAGHVVRKLASGESMLPTIPDGARVQIDPLLPTQIRRGDVVLFTADSGGLVVHRVVRLFNRQGRDFLQAWGDNNPCPDQPVAVQQVCGRVVAYESDEGQTQRLNSRNVFIYLFAKRYVWHFGRRVLSRVNQKFGEWFGAAPPL